MMEKQKNIIMEGYIGEIRGFGANFAPRAWAYCNGQLLAISSNTALFSILGTTFGGDGRTTFALPDLRGRMPLNSGGGAGPGLSDIRLGSRAGSEQEYMTLLSMPNHTHLATLRARKEQGDSFNPTGRVLSADAGSTLYTSATPDAPMSNTSVTIGNTGASQAVSIRNPYLGINMIICLQGIYPSRG